MGPSFLTTVLGVFLGVTMVLNIYIYHYPIFHGCKWAPDSEINLLALGDPQITGAGLNTALIKKLDIVGNDMFLAHTFKTLKRHLKPNVVAVMGDLISSQWIDNEEFYHRADRFEKIFPPSGLPLFNISGNHDVGYHGEMTKERVDRFESRYGAVNFVQEMGTPERPWRIVAVNSLSLDGPPVDDLYTKHTRLFLKEVAEQPYYGQTVLLTHVPLYKEAGVCVDGPYFTYYENGWLREQNHLSKESSELLVRSVFGSEGRGIVLAGHDHYGCAASYTVTEFQFIPHGDLSGTIPEITVKSMMGMYGGNGGLISGVWDKERSQWVFDFQLCPFQIQHLWWVTTVLTYISVGIGFVGIVWYLRRYLRVVLVPFASLFSPSNKYAELKRK